MWPTIARAADNGAKNSAARDNTPPSGKETTAMQGYCPARHRFTDKNNIVLIICYKREWSYITHKV